MLRDMTFQIHGSRRGLGSSPLPVCSSCRVDERTQLSRRTESAQWKIKLNPSGTRAGVMYSESFACMEMILCWFDLQCNTLPHSLARERGD